MNIQDLIERTSKSKNPQAVKAPSTQAANTATGASTATTATTATTGTQQTNQKLIVVLHSEGISGGRIGMMRQRIACSKLRGHKVVFLSTPRHASQLSRLFAALDDMKPTLIINQSWLVLQFLASGQRLTDFVAREDRHPKPYRYSPYTCCGSTYWVSLASQAAVPFEYVHEDARELTPVLCVYDDISILHRMNHGFWFIRRVLDKCLPYLVSDSAHEWFKTQPLFEFTVCSTQHHLLEFQRVANSCAAISLDIETSRVFITCIGYSCLIFDPRAACGFRIHTFVVPFFALNADETGYISYWKTQRQEEQAWYAIRQVHNNKVMKVMQNGVKFDAAYFIRYACPVRNLLIDTLVLINAIYVELPKKIDFQAALFLPTYAYWKQESKGEQDTKTKVTSSKLPRTQEDMSKYLAYNAKDCYYTLLVALELLEEAAKPKHAYAIPAYLRTLSLQGGSLSKATMMGIKINKQFFDALIASWHVQEQAGRNEFAALTANQALNFNAPQAVKAFVYDQMLFKPIPRHEGETDKKILHIIAERDVLARTLLSPLLSSKEAKANISKYSNMYDQWPKGRFMFGLSATGTVTERYSGSAHEFFIGTNPQNTPYSWRVALEADPGCYLVKFDYAQSDMYFTAFCLQVKAMIENVMSDKDTHCLHCAAFFRIGYDKLVEAHGNGEAWVSDNQTGVRSITKRVGYGCNYGMYEHTLFTTMGFNALSAAAKQLGMAYKTVDDVITCAAFLINVYRNELYAEQQTNLAQEYEAAIANEGYVVGAFGATRKFFGDLNRPGRQRNIASFFGQNGTAGNINRASLSIANDEACSRYGVRLALQVHDELVFSIPYGVLHKANKRIANLMMQPITIHGRTFTVPTEPDVGFGYGKRLLGWDKLESKTEVEIREMLHAHDAKLLAKLKAGAASQAIDLLADTVTLGKQVEQPQTWEAARAPQAREVNEQRQRKA